MIQALYNGVSGLRAHKTEMDVISNNIANVNTVGFKSSRVSFKEMFDQTLKGATAPSKGGVGGTNPMQLGLGVNIASIDTDQTQGAPQSTGRPMDCAVDGDGFFMLSNGQSKFYTRDGAFKTDSQGSLVSSSSGLKVLGWTADASGKIDASVPISAASSISMPIGKFAVARQTTDLIGGGNINADLAVGESASMSAGIYDTLGKLHNLTIKFTKTDTPDQWTWSASSPDATNGSILGSGTIVFDESGKSTLKSGDISLSLETPTGASDPIDLKVDFSSITQLVGNTDLNPMSQDGLPMGTLDDFSIGKDGVIMGSFTNGMSQALARIGLTQFSNSAGLDKVGNNLAVESANSGLPQVVLASEGGAGSINSGYLESSNVDLPTEFANMIIAQRGFQANSKIITTSDEMLQELVQLKR